MRTGRPKKPLEITEEDRDKLKMIALRPKSAQAMAMRARIVLSCGQGMSNFEVARKLHITGATIGKLKKSLRRHWNRCRPTAHTGALASWPKRRVYRKTPSFGSGALSDYSR